MRKKSLPWDSSSVWGQSNNMRHFKKGGCNIMDLLVLEAMFLILLEVKSYDLKVLFV